MNNLTNIQDIKNFIFAGKATLTLESLQSGKHFTFKIKKYEDLFFVSVLTGPDNYTNYSYMGIIKNDSFKLTEKSKITKDALSYKAFDFFFGQIMRNILDKNLLVYHSGKCGKCGKKLSTPESLERGLGPDCYKRN